MLLPRQVWSGSTRHDTFPRGVKFHAFRVTLTQRFAGPRRWSLHNILTNLLRRHRTRWAFVMLLSFICSESSDAVRQQNLREVLMKTLTTLFAGFVLSFTTFADSSSPAAQTAIVGPAGALVLREIRYDGKLSDDEARFVVDLDAEATGKGEASLKLFEGEVALLPAKWPNQLRIVREGNCYRLIAAHPGQLDRKSVV